MSELITIVSITATFLLAGVVKGVVGLGLPTVSLGLLAAFFDLTTAMALMLVPSFATNLWQAVDGNEGRAIILRIWPFLLMAAISVWLGALALTRVDLSLLTGLLGFLLVAYAIYGLAGFRLAIPAQSERWTGLICGSVNGVLTGMTGSFVVPGVMFLQGIGLSRDMLVQAMGMLFTVSTITLALALEINGLLTLRLNLLSFAAVIPAVAGMMIGQGIRRRIAEPRFRQVFYAAIFALGSAIVVKTVLAGA